jgi:hypothetical protein
VSFQGVEQGASEDERTAKGKAMNLYYGSNESHEFWENEDGTYLIIRHHNSKRWFALTVAGSYEPFGMAKRPQTIANRIQRHYGISLRLDRSRQWQLPRKNARRMKLVTAN